MAAKTPALTAATAGYVPVDSVHTGVVASGTVLTGNATIKKHTGMRLDVFYFDNIDDTDEWTSGIPNIQAVAWQADQDTVDDAAVRLTNQATGVVRFDCSSDDISGWVWVLRGM
jgi:hypothetical protein